jgi:putative hydrolase
MGNSDPSDSLEPDDWSDDGTPEDPSAWPAEGIADLLRQAGVPVQAGANLEQMLSQLAHQMAAQLREHGQTAGGEGADQVTWTAAREAARRRIAALGPDPVPDGRKTREIADAVHLVDLWLDDHTTFPSLALPPAAWSRAEWIEQTMPAWRTMIEPVISTIAQGLHTAMSERMNQTDDVPELAHWQSLLQPLLRQAADSIFGDHLGQELGRIATETVTATDLGFPLLAKPQVAILPTNLAAFTEGLGLPEGDILLYHAIREAARQRLFSEVAWISPQLVALVQHYAREMRIDPDALSTAIEESIPEEITIEAVSQFQVEINTVMFDPGKTPEQVAILERLEIFLALVEGWVDEVATQATAAWMPSAGAVAEMIRRRRAAGGPAAAVFSTLLGLTVRPKLLREAQAFWSELRASRGVSGRDEIWRHPDAMPTAADLSNPSTYLTHLETPSVEDPWDIELRRLLDGDAQGEVAGS